MFQCGERVRGYCGTVGETKTNVLAYWGYGTNSSNCIFYLNPNLIVESADCVLFYVVCLSAFMIFHPWKTFFLSRSDETMTGYLVSYNSYVMTLLSFHHNKQSWLSGTKWSPLGCLRPNKLFRIFPFSNFYLKKHQSYQNIVLVLGL